MEGLNTSQVAELLKKEGVRDDVVQLFVKSKVDGKALMMMETDVDCIKAVGITGVGDKLKLKNIIQKYKEDVNTDLPPTDHDERKSVSASGVVASIESLFTVTFNVIVSGVCWGWDKTSRSELYICLSPPELGGMESIHPLRVESLGVTDERFFVFKGFLEISYNIIKKHTYIYYKYAARTGRITAEIVAEHIWNVSSKKSVCRCIEIPFSEKRPGGVWEQWDTIVYPKEAETPHKVAPEGYLGKVARKVLSLGGEDTISRQITDDPENQDLADEQCLLIYLSSHHDRLIQSDVSSRDGVSQMVSTVHKIFEHLHNRQVALSTYADRTTCYYARKVWNSQRLPNVMGQWIKSVIHGLLTKLEQGGVDENQVGASLLSSVTVLCIGSETNTIAQLSEETCVDMANLLRKSYKPKHNACPAYYVLEDHIPTSKFRKIVAAALKKLAVTILQKSNERNWRWLQVLPLYHFVSHLNTPFKTISLNAEIECNFWKKLESARKKQTQASYYDALMNVEDLMGLDYMFAKVMLYMCPHNDMVVVLQNIDPILASKFYIWYVKNHGKEYITKAKDPQVFHQHVEALHMATFKSSNDVKWRRTLAAFVKIAHELMEAIIRELVGISESHCEILYHITRYVLSVISLKVSKEHGDDVGVNLKDLDEIDKPYKFIGTIDQWLVHKACVGHVKFGGYLLKKFEEVRAWQVLCKDTVCPENIKEHWIKAVEQLLEKRAKRVEDKTALVLRSDQRKLDTPALVSETLIRLATDDLMSQSLSQNELSKRVNILADQRHSSGDVSKLLSQILTRHLKKQDKVGKAENTHTHEGQAITIAQLISWDVWPIMIKITCDQQSGLFSNMTDNVKKICKSARNALQDTCNQIVNGRIIMNDLKAINKRSRKFLYLCSEAGIKDLEKWLPHLEAVVSYIGRVQVFHNLLNPRVKNYEALQEELQTTSVKTVAELCSNWSIETASADLKFTCCPTIEPCTQAILTPFDHLAVNSELFCRVWKRKLCTALMSHCGASQEDIVKFVWRPTVEDCWTFLNELKSRRILLSELWEQNIRQSCRALMRFLPSLNTEGIHFDGEDSMEWIDTVCEQVKYYYVSLKCIECAQVVIRLGDRLELKGDFTHMQNLGDKELSSRLPKLSLFEFTDLFQADVKILHRITNASKDNFLKSLENNWTLVEWIKEFESVKELQRFIDLALDTFDATDMTVTMLTVLRIVGSAVGQFLFNLPNPCGLNEFVTVCDQFWPGESFDHRLLRDCGKNLNHFMYIKDRLMCLAESAKEEESQLSDDESAVRPLEKTPRKLEDNNTEVSEICQIQQVLQLKYAKLEKAVEKLSTVNMSLQEANSQLNCLLQTSQHEIDTLNGTLSREQAEHQDQMAVMDQENERLKTTIVEQGEKLDQTMSELHSFQQECNELKQSLDQAYVVTHDHERRITELNDELLQANTETEHFKDCYHTKKNEKRRVEEELQTSTKLNAMLESQLKSRNHEIEAKNAELCELSGHLTTQMATDLRKLQIANDVEGLNIAEKKGAGSYGAVYEVRVNGVPCIAKRLHDILVGRGENEQVDDEQMRGAVKQFNRECVLLSRLRHPNIVQFMGVHSGDTEADVSLIMEYMHMDLEHCINTYPNIPLPYKTSILRDVTYGLAYLHSSNIIHRDLNTGNILLTQSLQAKIADVGVSKFFDRTLVRTRTKCPGAINFMPPEALTKSPKYGDKLDVFSFGHLTLCLLHQESPDLNDSGITAEDAELNQRQVGKRREAIEKMGSGHPLCSIVVQCLSDIPEQRPTSRELVTRMERICQQHPIPHKNLLEVVAANQ